MSLIVSGIGAPSPQTAGVFLAEYTETLDPSNPSHARTVWFVGLSASGKTTLASELSQRLRAAGRCAVLLDGDALRSGVSRDLGFSRADRARHLARVRAMASLLNEQGVWACVACITPFESARRLNRTHLSHYTEVYVRCPLDVCIQRDPKGLYARALEHSSPEFTGLSQAFEPPKDPDVLLDTSTHNVDDCILQLWQHLLAASPDLLDPPG